MATEAHRKAVAKFQATKARVNVWMSPDGKEKLTEYAKTTPFGGLIAPGVMSFMAVWAKYLEVDFFGEELLAGKSTKIEWLKPVFAEDILTARATVTNLTRRNARNGIVEITIEAYNQNRELVLTDVTEAIVKSKPSL